MTGSVDTYTTAAGKRWRIRYELPPDPATGKRRVRAQRGFTRARDAQRALRDALKAVEDRPDLYAQPDRGRQPLAVYLRAWPPGSRTAPTTVAGYRQSAEVYASRASGASGSGRSGPSTWTSWIQTWSGRVVTTGPGSRRRRSATFTMLHAALVEAAERGYVARNVASLAHPPTAKAARSRAALERVWTPAQLHAFLQVAEADRLYAAWHLLATTGMRRGVVLGPSWSDVDLDAARLRVSRALMLVGNAPHWTEAKTERGARRFSIDGHRCRAPRAPRPSGGGEAPRRASVAGRTRARVHPGRWRARTPGLLRPAAPGARQGARACRPSASTASATPT